MNGLKACDSISAMESSSNPATQIALGQVSLRVKSQVCGQAQTTTAAVRKLTTKYGR